MPQVTISKPPQWDAVETPLVAEFKISSPMLMSGGKRVLLPTNIFQFNRPPMFAHPDRTAADLLRVSRAVRSTMCTLSCQPTCRSKACRPTRM